jgi:hypothetical protein
VAIVCGRKFCSACGKWRLVSDFPCRRRDPLRLQGRCHPCTNAYRREWAKGHPEQVKAASRKHREANLERLRKQEREYERKRRADPRTGPVVREQHRAYLSRIKQDPERWQRMLADRRMDYRLKAMREGRKVREIRKETYANGNGKAKVKARFAAEPLAALISEWLGELGGRPLTNGAYNANPSLQGAGYTHLAELTGVSDRRLRAIVGGEQPLVSSVVADAICTALETPLASVYLEDE